MSRSTAKRGKSPLGDLRTLWQQTKQQAQQQTTREQRVAPEKPEPPGMVRAADDVPQVKPPFIKKKHTAASDVDFRQAMRAEQVVPLPPGANRRAAIHVERPKPVPRQKWLDEREVLVLAKYGGEPSPRSWDIGQELEDDQTFLRTGLAPDVLRKLRRGQWAIQREIDLHGLTADEAHDALLNFLVNARTRGLRCVRIIHGKGLTSPDKTPVLKGKVRRWLSMWDDVLAYCEPGHHAGGGGAVVVLLRGR